MTKQKRKDNGISAPTGAPADGEAPRERVAMRAYELYLARGAADGQELEDWLAAERELKGPTTRPSES